MGNKISRVVVALLIGISFPIFTGNQVVSAAPEVSGVLGDSCEMFFQSRVIATDSTLTTEIAGVCFPSLNNKAIFIWSKDNNQIPAYTLVVDNDGKIAFGRNCVIINENDCSIPDPKPSRYLEAEPFVRAYPDTKYYPDDKNESRSADTFGGLWFSETYLSNIVAANYVAPEAIAEVEDAAQVNEPISSQVVSSTLLIGLAAAVSLTSAAGSSSSQPSPNRAESPEAPELLRARKERRFKITNQFSRFFQGSVISMDRWAFFTAKMPALIRWFGKRSAVVATSIGDADYLRAILGIFSLLIYPVAIIIGAMESISLVKETSPIPIPGTTWLILAIVIGCFDSLAGAISAITFGLLTVLKVFGLLTFLPKVEYTSIDWTNFIGSLGIVYILSTGPALFAGALRRFDGVHTSRKGKWERLVDYALSPIVTAWVVWKSLELLPKISEADIPNWSIDIRSIGLIVFICIFIRYFLEGFVAKHFAERINEIVTESIPMQKLPHFFLHIRKGMYFSFFAYLLLVPEPVSEEIMWLIFFILLLPAAIHGFELKSKDRIAKFNIIGTPRLAFLLCTVLALNSIFTSKGVGSNLGLFIVIAFGPILYFNLMEALTESHLNSPTYFYQTRTGRFLYRAGSVLLYIFILGVIYTQVGWKP
jgi:hypothetical protein